MKSLGKREHQKLEVRSRITSAAFELLSEKGYENLIIDEVCSIAKVARKTFYNYYLSKDDLLDNLCQLLFYEEMSNMVEIALEQHKNLGERLCYLFQSIAQRLDAFESLERTLISYTLANIHFDENNHALEMITVNQTVDHLIEASLLDDSTAPLPCSVNLLREMVVGMLLSLVFNWIYDRQYDLQKSTDEWCDFLKYSFRQ